MENWGKYKEKHLNILAEALKEALSRRGFIAYHVKTKEEALETVLSIIPPASTVGIPGSVTIREIGAIKRLEERKCIVYHHWIKNLSPEEKNEILKNENEASFFLTSSNAITRDGVLVNVDGVGNRISAMAWGRGILIFVISMNKVTDDVESAIRFIRNHSCPLSAIRQQIETPCAAVGYCVECAGEKKLCKAFLILEKPTTGRKIHVILVNELLGC